MIMEMGAPFSEMELASFMSLSKGYMGECGLRGGWTELVNMDKEVQAHLFKGISSNLCPTSLGQAGMDCVVSVSVTLNYTISTGCPPRQRPVDHFIYQIMLLIQVIHTGALAHFITLLIVYCD